MAKPEWLEVAEKELGVSEITGIKANPRIIEYDACTSLKATSDEVAWCSSFACWVFEMCHIRSPRSAAARSWLDWGRVIDEPIAGCIVVLKRGNNPQSGHVGLYVSSAGGFIKVLGGNQSDCVKYSNYPIADVLGYRVPNV